MKIFMVFGLAFLSSPVSEACKGCVGKLTLINSAIYFGLDFIKLIILSVLINGLNVLTICRINRTRSGSMQWQAYCLVGHAANEVYQRLLVTKS